MSVGCLSSSSKKEGGDHHYEAIVPEDWLPPVLGGFEDLMDYFLLLTTLVIACLMVIPAFSISRFDKPEVMHTFNAG